MNDKIIYVKRSVPFVHDQINSEAMQEQLASTHRSIGSYFTASGRTGTGLNHEEEKFLMAHHFGMDENDPKLRETTEKYFEDIATKIPGGKKGLELNIGLKVDNNKPVARDNMPIKLFDYIRYRHILGYHKTAPSPELAAGNPLIEYYIEDPLKVLESESKQLEVRDQAMQEYLKVKDDNDRVNMILSLMKQFMRKQQGVPPVNLGQLKEAKHLKEKQLLLRELVNMRPERFYQVTTDPNIKKRYFVDELITTGLLKRVGNAIVDTTDSNRSLGFTDTEVINLLTDPKESMTLTRLRSELDGIYNKKKVLV